jgi:hypothetical protein
LRKETQDFRGFVGFNFVLFCKSQLKLNLQSTYNNAAVNYIGEAEYLGGHSQHSQGMKNWL